MSEKGAKLGGHASYESRPLVLSASLSGGVAESASLIDGRASTRLDVRRLELFAEFEYLHIGPSNLYTPLIGARL